MAHDALELLDARKPPICIARKLKGLAVLLGPFPRAFSPGSLLPHEACGRVCDSSVSMVGESTHLITITLSG